MTPQEKETAKFFGAKLKIAREDAELKQTELGELIGKNGNIIWTLEAGKRLPFFEEYKEFRDSLNKTEEFFWPEGKVPRLDRDPNPGRKYAPTRKESKRSNQRRATGTPYKARAATGHPGEGELFPAYEPDGIVHEEDLNKAQEEAEIISQSDPETNIDKNIANALKAAEQINNLSYIPDAMEEVAVHSDTEPNVTSNEPSIEPEASTPVQQEAIRFDDGTIIVTVKSKIKVKEIHITFE